MFLRLKWLPSLHFFTLQFSGCCKIVSRKFQFRFQFFFQDYSSTTKVESSAFSTVQLSLNLTMLAIVVSPQNFDTSSHTMVPIFCMKLNIHKGKKVTRPDFPGKIRIIQ